MQIKQIKLENPLRLAELNPTETLKRIGLLANYSLCDIGAGSGIFTLPAASITRNKVYALEISDEMLTIIGAKAQAEGRDNIELVKVKGDHFALEDHLVDIVLLVTVLHEIENITALLEELQRIVKDNGKIAVIEFHKRVTPMGPPIDHRMGKEDTVANLKKAGFIVCEDFDLGDNFYCLVFHR